MSIRYFGEYLASAEIVSWDHIVEALIEQLETLPVSSRLAKEHNIFSSQEFMQIFRCQQEEGLSFLVASKKLGLLNSEKEQRIKDLIDEKRVPLGQILIEKGHLDLKTLTSSLDEFLSQVELNTDPLPVNAGADQNDDHEIAKHLLTNASEEVKQSSGANAALPEGMRLDFEQVFDNRKMRVMKVALSLIKDNTQADPASAVKLYMDIIKVAKPISGIANLFEMGCLKNLLKALEQTILNQIDRTGSDDFHSKNVELVPKLGAALSQAWELRQHILESGNESSYFANPTSFDTYQDVLMEMESF